MEVCVSRRTVKWKTKLHTQIRKIEETEMHNITAVTCGNEKEES